MTTGMLVGLGALALALLLISARRLRPSTPRRPVDSGDPGFVPTDTGSDRDKPEGTDDGGEGDGGEGGGGDGGDAGGSDGGGGGD